MPSISTSQVASATTPVLPRALPPLGNLGLDLLRVGPIRRSATVLLPFACAAAFVVFASRGWWPAAVLAAVAYSFFSYGSTSHDLVHANLGLSKLANHVALSLVELIGLRSGHAYRAVHLHHHARFPHPDDLEGSAASRSFLGALLMGPLHQARLWLWAMRHSRRDRTWIVAEGVLCVLSLGLAIAVWPFTPVPLSWCVLALLGSWVYPLMTAYLPHNPRGIGPLAQTRRFRGWVASYLFAQHLYHLEHHLYPMVPHHHWPALARRLDPLLDDAGIEPITFGF